MRNAKQAENGEQTHSIYTVQRGGQERKKIGRDFQRYTIREITKEEEM